VEFVPAWHCAISDTSKARTSRSSIVTGGGAPERLAEAAAALVRRPVDLIATFGTPPTRAAKEATATVPIVMIGIGDPVRAQLVGSLAQPGGNVTGNTILGPDLSAKRLQLLKEVLPPVTRVTFLWNRNNASNVAILEQLQVAAPAAGMTLMSRRTTAETSTVPSLP
jgi:putative tryptophan/tyrosine transport system substrate-binding protein